MKFTAALSVLALAATATAVPTDVAVRGNKGTPPSKGNCNNESSQVCCNGVLSCLVQVLGDNCEAQAFCCEGGNAVGTVVNVALLNCVSL